MVQSSTGALPPKPFGRTKLWLRWAAICAFVASLAVTVWNSTEVGHKYAKAASETCRRLALCEMLVLDSEPVSGQASIAAWPSQEAYSQLIPPEYNQHQTPTLLSVQCLIGKDGSVKRCGAISGPPDNRLLAAAIELLTQHAKVNPAVVDGHAIESYFVFSLSVGGQQAARLTVPPNQIFPRLNRQKPERIGPNRFSSTETPLQLAAPSALSGQTARDAISPPTPVNKERNVETKENFRDVMAIANSDKSFACTPWNEHLYQFERVKNPPYPYEVDCWDQVAKRRFYRDVQGKYFWSDLT